LKMKKLLTTFKRPPQGALLIIISLTFTFITALSLRLLPWLYGYDVLTEFDPYFQYWMTKYVVERGWKGFIDWFSWSLDPRFWYPYGRDVAISAFPGVAFTGAFLYFIASALGFNTHLMLFCALVPPFMGALTTFAIYFLGREVESKEVGLYAALFLAVNVAYLQRTVFGFYDDESVGILAMVCSLTFYVRALRRGSWINATLAGAFLAYMASSWGAYLYLFAILVLHAVVTVLLRQYSSKLLIVYSTTIGVFMMLASQIPKIGLNLPFSGIGIAAIVALVLLMISEVGERMGKKELAYLASIVLLIAIGILITVSVEFSKFLGLTARYLSVLNPFIRRTLPIVESVAEHRATVWTSMTGEYLALPLFALFGLYILIKRRGDVIASLLCVLFLASLYAAGSMSRLTLLLVPMLCLLGAIGLKHLITPFLELMFKPIPVKRRVKLGLGRNYGVATLTLILLLLVPTVSMPYALKAANTPPILATSSLPLARPAPDWLSALSWMRENLHNAVVATWWDYGYWVAVVGNCNSTCDNSTTNTTQIVQIARAFLSNESVALKIYRQLGVTHVAVFGWFVRVGEGLYVSYGYDDVSKSYWMAKIGGLNPDDYIGEWGPIVLPKGPKAEEAVLFRMLYTSDPEVGRALYIRDVEVTERGVMVKEFFTPKPLEHFKLVYASEPNRYVLIYEVVYD